MVDFLWCAGHDTTSATRTGFGSLMLTASSGVSALRSALTRSFRFIRASLKGLHFFVSKREPSIKYMTEALRMNDRELINAIYDIQAKLVLRDGFTDDKVLQSMIDEMKKTTKVQRDIKVSDIFDLSFVKKANEELKTSGWKP